jgi:hypothetical protein
MINEIFRAADTREGRVPFTSIHRRSVDQDFVGTNASLGFE